jgi:hypothetical protein
MLKTKEYCIVSLKGEPNKTMAGVEKIIWDHEQRNFSLLSDGLLSIVCPVRDGTEIHDVGIFNAGRDEVRSIMEEDPNVKAGFCIRSPCMQEFPGRLPLVILRVLGIRSSLGIWIEAISIMLAAIPNRR